MQIGVGKATGKIILMGEHAVVYGQPAIAIPFFATKVVATVIKNADDTITSTYYDGPLEFVPDALKNIHHSFILAKANTGITDHLALTIESSIPPERGMGSSAAVANAVIRAVYHYTNCDLSSEKLTELVTVAEKITHGNPSGIDQAATSGRHPIYFVKNQPLRQFPLNINGYLIVADSKIKGRTREVVTAVAELIRRDPTQKKAIERLGALTELTRQALTHDHLDQLAAAMTEAQLLLRQLGVSSAHLDDLLALGLKKGALAGKLTGGGRGGCVFFVAKTYDEARTIQDGLIAAGFPTWIQDFKELT